MKLGGLAALVLVFASVASASTARPLVPLFTQHQIASRASTFAFVPARIATGYRYARWTFANATLRIWFRNRAQKQIVFVASRQRASDCTVGRQKTFQMGGNKVFWAQTVDDQESWRCIGGVRVAATTTDPPTRFADVGLGQVAASAHRIR